MLSQMAKDINTVCIVGHGPSLVGANLGKFIDSHDCVIRMVECDWQSVKDYGRKYNIGVYSIGPSLLWVYRSKCRPDMYFFYKTKIGKELAVMDDEVIKPSSGINGIFTVVLKKTVWEWIVKANLKKARHFSRGTAAVIASLTYFNPKKITIVGFDAVLNGFKPNHHPQALKRIHKSLAKGGNTHDWTKEKEVISLLNEYVNIQILP